MDKLIKKVKELQLNNKECLYITDEIELMSAMQISKVIEKLEVYKSCNTYANIPHLKYITSNKNEIGSKQVDDEVEPKVSSSQVGDEVKVEVPGLKYIDSDSDEE